MTLVLENFLATMYNTNVSTNRIGRCIYMNFVHNITLPTSDERLTTQNDSRDKMKL